VEDSLGNVEVASLQNGDTTAAEAKLKLPEVMDFLKDPHKDTTLGARFPRDACLGLGRQNPLML
jgi:ATP-dependent Zn protease